MIVCALLLPVLVSARAQEASLDDEINALASDLATQKDLAVTIDRRFLTKLAEQFARASTRDVQIKLLPGRIHSSESDLGFAKYSNYLDLDGGEGSVDLRQATIEEINNDRIHLFIDAAGQLQAQAHGKQIGFTFTTQPKIGVSLRDRVALAIDTAGGEFRLRPLPKKLNVHLDILVPVPSLGTSVNASRDLAVDAALSRPIPLPRVISTRVNLPGRERQVVLIDTGYQAANNKLKLDASIDFKP